MPDYRIYVVGDDGHFFSSLPLRDCPNDETALQAAKQIIDGRDVEVWHLARKIAVLDGRTKSLKGG